jgi:hypothetical protein
MALVHQNSCECTKSELDLFEVLPTQTSVEHGYWELKGLPSSLTDQGPYEFAVSGAGDNYIDLFNTYLFVEAQIVNTEGSNLDLIRTSDQSICGCIHCSVTSGLA